MSVHLRSAISACCVLLSVFIFSMQVASAQSGTTRYVDISSGNDAGNCTDSSAPCSSIGYALEQADTGDEIRVAEGTYVENILIDKRVALRGGYTVTSQGWILIPHKRSVIDGGGESVALPAVIFQDQANDAVFSRFVVTNSKTNQSGQAAIKVIVVSVTIQDSTVTGNSTSGVTQEWGSGGILIDESPDTLIQRTIFFNNTTDGGAGAIRLGGGNATIENSLIYGNTGRVSIHSNDSQMMLDHATITDNGSDGGLFLNNSDATIQYSIIWEEDGPGIVLVEGASISSMTYSNYEDGLAPGAGNISADPLFVSPGSSDYHLSDGSPSIAAGLNAPTLTYDLEGNPRLGAPDMGAYERNRNIYLPVVRAF